MGSRCGDGRTSRPYEDDVANGVEQGTFFYRLAEMQIASSGERALYVFLERGRGKRDDRRRLACVIALPFADHAGCFKSVDYRHLNIHENHVVAAGGKFLESLFPVLGKRNFAGLATQVGADQKPVVGGIVGDQYSASPQVGRLSSGIS